MGAFRPSPLLKGTEGRTHAAVLVPILEMEGGLGVLVTRRSSHVLHHKGQISFPGGHREPSDRSFEDTALRETEEEIGLPREDIQVLGGLDDALTLGSGFVLHPLVGIVPYPYPFHPNAREVEAILFPPIAAFSRGNLLLRPWPGPDQQGMVTEAFVWGGETIWGATARILVNLTDVLGIDG